MSGRRKRVRTSRHGTGTPLGPVEPRFTTVRVVRRRKGTGSSPPPRTLRGWTLRSEIVPRDDRLGDTDWGAGDRGKGPCGVETGTTSRSGSKGRGVVVQGPGSEGPTRHLSVL